MAEQAISTESRMRRWVGRPLGTLIIAGVFAAIAGLAALGTFQIFDNDLSDLRFNTETRGVSDTIAYVDIDSASLTRVGVWPWPRHIHADILDALMQLGANEVAFDIDFSVASTEENDAAFEAALARAGGYAFLAAFQQQKVGDRQATFNLPIERFRQYASPVAVNVIMDAGGLVRTYPYAMTTGTDKIPSIAAIFSGVNGPANSGFGIDYSIHPHAIDRISVSDLLDGKVDAARISGKNIVVGASAVELRDYFVVPRWGVLPGALLQAVAAETLVQGRALQPLGHWPPAIVVLAVGCFALLARRRLTLLPSFILAPLLSTTAELAALALHQRLGLESDTAAVHLANIAFVMIFLIDEMVKRGRERARATRERDAVRLVLDRVITDNFDGVVVVNAANRVVAASHAAETLLGRPLDETNADETLPPELGDLVTKCLAGENGHGEIALPAGDDKIILEYVVTRSSVSLDDGPTSIACLTFRDVTQRRENEEQLRFMGGHDSLTGTLRRTRLVEMMQQTLADPAREVAVVVVNLRRFRFINDSLGHSQGDMLLRQVASRLRSMGPDAVARLGGDSFALVVPDMADPQLADFCKTVGQWLSFPYQLADGHQATIAAAAGATRSPLSGRDPEVLLSHADMALSAAKLITGNGVALFSPDMDRRLQERQEMDAALRRALERNEFNLLFQPQVELKSGRMSGAEALVRWAHPTLGPVSPARFIPAAEETGLIVELGRWALIQACREAVLWPAHLKVAVNVSPVQFELSDVVEDVRKALQQTGLDPSRLEVEITEGIFVRNFTEVADRLRSLRALGISVALDDFGTGYSSLNYLAVLPVDKIKVDQSFVRRLPGDPEAAAIVNAVIMLASSLGKRVIAEGIETQDQAWILNIGGCTYGQGYYFGQAMTSESLARAGAAPALEQTA